LKCHESAIFTVTKRYLERCPFLCGYIGTEYAGANIVVVATWDFWSYQGKSELSAENALLWQQLIVLLFVAKKARRSSRGCPKSASEKTYHSLRYCEAPFDHSWLTQECHTSAFLGHILANCIRLDGMRNGKQ